MNAAPLGVFDSGIGGLTVAHALFECLPQESVIYFGDTARVPYGPKSPETVRRYSGEILDFLVRRGVKMVVVACNTSTAHALDFLRQRSPVPVLGVIEPGARAAAAATRAGRIGVIGTAGTIASGAYERAIKAIRADLVVVSQACPLLVPFVEEGWFDHPAAELVAREYLRPLQAGGRGRAGARLHALSAVEAAARARDGTGCAAHRQRGGDGRRRPAASSRRAGCWPLPIPGGRPMHHFVVSDDEPRFRRVGARFSGEQLQNVELVPL